MNKTYLIMGVSGSGKTTVGKLLAKQLNLPFYDADDFHSEANKAKMASGIPLSDIDRLPWLQALQRHLKSCEGAVLACSALKESYRQILSEGNTITYIYLKGDYETILKRMEARVHYMKPAMLQSQFNTLEPPSYGISVGIENPPEALVSEIISKLAGMKSTTFGIIGMGVMGRSLAKNILAKGFPLSVYNRLTETEKAIIPSLLSEVNTPNLQGFTDLSAFVASLETPRKILLMIPAGDPVDKMLSELTPLLSEKDILMDGGNSHYKDTRRREQQMNTQGFRYVGIGISGGEQGALTGPSMMVGGSKESYQQVKELLEAICAKDFNNKPCVARFGTNGAGHFIKTIHNGIEYAEMQLLAEVYGLLRSSLPNDEIAAVLRKWNEGECSSFLLETTIAVLEKKEDHDFLLNKILDIAGSKGTGTWSSQTALEQGFPATILTEAVMERALSAQKHLRTELAKKVAFTSQNVTIDTETLKSAYQFARILNHQQGLQLMETTAKTEGWTIDIAEVVRVWTNGCILKSVLLKNIHPLLTLEPHLLRHESILQALTVSEANCAEVIHLGIKQRTTLPCLSAALQYWYGISTQYSTANIIQAQRDAFGAHTYKRIDKPEQQSFTTQWNSDG
ncbi:MAG: NADP-dependent phosphogluconate dehydrogenase [Flavobacteriaceae bacterium]